MNEPEVIPFSRAYRKRVYRAIERLLDETEKYLEELDDDEPPPEAA